jgi:hypothetical protein
LLGRAEQIQPETASGPRRSKEHALTTAPNIHWLLGGDYARDKFELKGHLIGDRRRRRFAPLISN